MLQKFVCYLSFVVCEIYSDFVVCKINFLLILRGE